MSRISSPLPIVPVILAIAALTTGGLVGAQAGGDAEAASDLLRRLYLARDWEQGSANGAELVKEFPDSSRLRAWWLLNKALNRHVEEAIGEAEAMTLQAPQDPWGWFALAGTLAQDSERTEEALAAGRKLLEMTPDWPQSVWLQATLLAGRKDLGPALEFVDANLNKAGSWTAQLLTVKGTALYRQSTEGGDEQLFQQALAVFEQARKADEADFDAHFLPGTYLTGKNRLAEALPLLKRALEISPHSNNALSSFWWASYRLSGGAAETADEIKRSMDAHLAERKGYPQAVYTVYSRCRSFGFEEREKSLAETILNEFPDSAGAEWVLVNRFRDFAKRMSEEGLQQDENAQQTYRAMLTDFVRRPHPIRKSLLGDAYRNLFSSLNSDPHPDPHKLLETVRGMVQYDDFNPHFAYAKGPVALAEKTPFLKEAEEIARAGLEAGRRKVEEDRRYYKTEQDYREAQDYIESIVRDALGWVLFQAGRLEESEKDLSRAHQLDERNIDNLYHLGRLYEATDRPEEAEKSYIRGLSIDSPGDNPSEQAIRSLYLSRHGNLEGFEAYRANLDEVDCSNRKEEVLASLIEDPQPIPAFALKTLEGATISADDLKAKIVVINFWGIWCGWCVRELPEFQQLHDKYQDDPSVLVLSVNYNDLAKDIPAWMEEKGYSFPVLLDDRWVSEAGVTVFPTTWFLNPQGEKAFEEIGWTEKLLEEFSWRIEALRAK